MPSVWVQITIEQLLEAVRQLPEKERHKLRKQLDESLSAVKTPRSKPGRKAREKNETAR